MLDQERIKMQKKQDQIERELDEAADKVEQLQEERD